MLTNVALLMAVAMLYRIGVGLIRMAVAERSSAASLLSTALLNAGTTTGDILMQAVERHKADAYGYKAVGYFIAGSAWLLLFIFIGRVFLC